MSDTHVSITGFVATDVKFIRSERGTPLASFRLGSTPRRFDRTQGTWVDGRTTFVTVLCWRSLAENVASSVHKGEPVVVLGRLRVESWERDGRSGISAEVEAQSVGHDQARGTSMFRKARRDAPERATDTEAATRLARSWDHEDDGSLATEPGETPETSGAGEVAEGTAATARFAKPSGSDPSGSDPSGSGSGGSGSGGSGPGGRKAGSAGVDGARRAA